MKSQKIQEMSSEALVKRKTTTVAATATLAGILTVLMAMALFLCFNRDLSVGLPLLVTGLSLSTIVWINFADVRAVQKELQTRNQAL